MSSEVDIIPETQMEESDIDTDSSHTLSESRPVLDSPNLRMSAISDKSFEMHTSDPQSFSNFQYVSQSKFPSLPTPSPLNPSLPSHPSAPSPCYSCTDDLNDPKGIKRTRNPSDGSESDTFEGFKNPKNPHKEFFFDDSFGENTGSVSLNLKLTESGNKNSVNSQNPGKITQASGQVGQSVMAEKSPQDNYVNISEEPCDDMNNYGRFNVANSNSETNSNQNHVTDRVLAHQIIIINPDENAIREGFFKNPLKIFRLLESSPFKDAQIIESRPNLQRKIQVIKIRNTSKTNELLRINKLGEFNIHCSLPQSIKFKVGMIGPVDLSISPDDIMELLTEQGYRNPKVERFVLGKGDNARITKTMKIWFQLETLPPHLTLMYQRFEVTPFIERPWQCFKCQQFGHSAKFCKNKDVCLICSGNHNLKECQYKNDINKRKCINCGENHTSNDKGCKKILEEKRIQYIKAYQNLSYRDAVISAKKNSQENKTQAPKTLSNTTPKNQTTDQPMEKQIINTKEANTQTINKEIIEITPQKSETAHAEKIALILFEIFNSLNKSDSIQKKCTTITTAVSTHFGISLNKNHLLTSFKQISSKANTNQSQIINTKSIHGISKS